MRCELLTEELLHAKIDFFTFDGDFSDSYDGLISYRKCESRDVIVLFVDFEKSNEKSRSLLDFLASHQEELNAHATSIVGQKELVVTCFNCHVITGYRSDTKSLFGRCGKLIEIICEAWIEDELICSPDDVISWHSAFFSVYGLYLFSGCRNDFNYSIIFRCNKEIEFAYSNLQSQIINTFSGNYKLPINNFNAAVNVRFIRPISFKKTCDYIYSFKSFLELIFGVTVAFGQLICDDRPVLCEDGIIIERSSFWLKESIREKKYFETEPRLNPLTDIGQIEENSDVVFERWNTAYQEHSTAVTVLERVKENPYSDSEYIYDIAELVRAVLILVEDKEPSYKKLSNKVKLSQIMQKLGVINYSDDAWKLAEVRNACSHSYEIKRDIVTFEEMPRLRNVAMNLFKAYMIKQVLLLSV